MKLLTKIIAVLLLLIFLVSTIAGSVLAEKNSISLNARWDDKDYGENLSVMEGQEAKIFLTVLSTNDFALHIDLYEKEAPSEKGTPKWIKTSFADEQIKEHKFKQTFPISTKGLGSIPGKDYLVRIEVVNSLTSEVQRTYLGLKVSKRLNLPIDLGKDPEKDDKNEAPSTSSIPAQEVFEGSNLQFNIFSKDPNNDYLNVEGEVCAARILGACFYYYDLPDIGAYLQIKESKQGLNHAVFSWKPDYDFIKHPTAAKQITVRFRADDGEEKSSWTYVNIMVKDVNRAPKLNHIPDQQITASAVLDFTISAADPDKDQLYFYAFNKPSSANFIDNGDGTASFSWAPLPEDAGVYELTFLVNDGPFQGVDSQKVVIKVNGFVDEDTEEPGDTPEETNHKPVAVDDFVSTEGSVLIDVLANDYDAEGDAIVLSALGSPKHGTAQIKEGKVLYIPDADFFSGSDFFDYQITDGKDISSAMVNVEKVYVDDNNKEREQCGLEGQYFLAKEGKLDFEGQTIYLENVFFHEDFLDKETALISVREGFSPNLNFDYFTVCDTKVVGKLKITVTRLYWDGTRASEDSWIEFNVEYVGNEDPESPPEAVNRKPVALDDHVFLVGNLIEIDVLANDYDPDSDALSISALGDAKYGMVEIKNNKILYTPAENFQSGQDSFDYQITDGKEGYGSAMVYITRSFEDDGNHAPVLDPIGDKVVKEGELLTFKVTASDQDGDELKFYASFLPEGATFDPETQVFSWIPGYDQANKPQYSEFQELYDQGYIGDNGKYITTFVVTDGELFDLELARITVFDAEEPSQEEPQLPYTNIKFKSVSIAQEGDYAYLNAFLLNNGNTDLKDLRVTATIYSLGVKGSGSIFSLDIGENKSANVYVPLPYGADTGYYLVKITAKNSYYHDSAYRLLYLG